jgi:hypothetical protein
MSRSDPITTDPITTILTEDLRIMRSAFILAALSNLDYVAQEPDKASIYLK